MKWIRIDRAFPLPDHVKKALQRLDEAGHVAYIVGGSVRDLLLGRTAKDHDIATSASPDELTDLFPEAITVGKAFGVLKIPIRDTSSEAQEFLEIATFREDLEYEDHRHPTNVKFSGPAEDAKRRDFTINALFYDPKTARILDTVNGLEDLNAKLIRAIGNPRQRFREDALRLLRAVRFSGALDFAIEKGTAEALREKARLVSHVSGERIRDELNLMLTGPKPKLSIENLSSLGLLKVILPELEALKGVAQSPLYHPEGDVWAHTLKTLERLTQQHPKRSMVLAWGALLHDVGKAQASARNARRNFNGHEVDGARITKIICERLRMSGAETEAISGLVADHLKFKDVFQMRESTLQRFIRQPHFEDLLELHHADATASDGNLAYYEFCASRFQEFKNQPTPSAPRLIDGNDLIQLGIKPGPEFSQIIRTIEDLALEGALHSKEDALEYVIKHFVK